ncbi:MAG TPA: tRNA (adenosine(37)-N6)-dimethylallyltransferase MiaA [Anaerolineaceae bacterium]|nr:tRNA (adenosine(37)-N6)-dimethylallyltransferase MiaA [Anaerolineaceae bacterium]
MLSAYKPPLVVIVGPTAVGKTDLAVQLAQQLKTEIISADSRQIYRKMDIGTAKPDKTQLALVRHHLIDIVEPEETYSLAVFQSQAREIIGQLQIMGKVPMLVGGTGQYIRAVVQGWKPPELKPDLELRRNLVEDAARNGVGRLLAQLQERDPVSAERIDPRNIRRVIRALEVTIQTGRPFSDQRLLEPPPYRVIQIGLNRPREELYQRIDQRIDQMIQAGLLAEVTAILKDGCPEDAPSMSAIGYREMVAVLNGKIGMEEAVVLMKRATRNYIRRQANWFSLRDEAIHWFNMQEDTLSQVAGFLTKEI